VLTAKVTTKNHLIQSLGVCDLLILHECGIFLLKAIKIRSYWAMTNIKEF